VQRDCLFNPRDNPIVTSGHREFIRARDRNRAISPFNT
jgi:hypothetical protein